MMRETETMHREAEQTDRDLEWSLNVEVAA
jgi:hypothetical protein